MTDIIASPAVKEAVKVVMEQQERLGDEAAAEARESQPIRTSVLRAAQLAAEAEDHARGRQHVKGKLTARERLDLLLDTGSFEEIGRFRGGDINGGRAGSAVITGFGEVFGRKVAVYAQDFSVKGGTLGVAEGRKICHLMDKALDLKVPIIALIDSGGARIQEGVAALTEYGHLFRKTCDASGFVPQLSLILGPCAGGAVYCPALTDLIIMTRENSNMFVTGPDVVKAATGEVISMDDLAAATCTTPRPAWPTISARTRPTRSTTRVPCSPICRPTPTSSRPSTRTRRPAPTVTWPNASPPSCRTTTASRMTCST